MTTVLLTGFEPFGGETTNPSWAAVERVRDTWTGPECVHIRRLSVDFATVDDELLGAFEELEPDLVVCVGQAGGSDVLRVERVAINVDDARIPDNGGRQPIDEPIVVGGPAAYFSTLPIKAVVAQLDRLGIPATVSQTAGTFTCNHVFYTLMHAIAGAERATRGGLIHVPFSPDQAAGTGAASMDVEMIARAISVVLSTTLANPIDVTVGGGALD